MGATNSTTYYQLPIFASSDSPKWLVDWPDAMNKIDAAIHTAEGKADTNATAIATLQSNVESLSGSISSQGASITTLTQNLTTLTGTVNTITALIGNGEPTTTDKTIIGAINELHAEIQALDPSGQGIEAGNVSYDNTNSGLTADDVQEAIDELKSLIPSTPTATEEVVRGTLTAGQTSLALTTQDQTIGANTLIDYYTGEFGVDPTNITIASNTVTFTFEAQASDLSVAMVVRN